MNIAMRDRVNDLVNHHGSVQRAIENRQSVIARRLAEGKGSPCAEAEIAALLELEPTYNTPEQAELCRRFPIGGDLENPHF